MVSGALNARRVNRFAINERSRVVLYISATQMHMLVGDVATIVPAVTSFSDEGVTALGYGYTTSNAAIATVTSGGLITAVAIGTCTVTTITEGGRVRRTTPVTVVATAGAPTVGPLQNGAGTGLIYRFVPGDYASPAALSAAVDAETTPFLPQDDVVSGNFALATFDTQLGATVMHGYDTYSRAPLSPAPTSIWVRAVMYIGPGPLAVLEAFPLIFVRSDDEEGAITASLTAGYESGESGATASETGQLNLDSNGATFPAVAMDFDGFVDTLVDFRAKYTINELGPGEINTEYDTIVTDISINGQAYDIGPLHGPVQEFAAPPAFDYIDFFTNMLDGGLVRHEVYDASINDNPWEPIPQAVAASITITTTTGRRIKKTVRATTQVNAGSTVKRTLRALAAGVTTTANVARQVRHIMAGSSTATTMVVWKTRRPLAASSSLTTIVRRAIHYALASSSTLTTTVRRRALHTLAASSTGTTALRRVTKHVLAASSTLTTALQRVWRTYRTVSASSTLTTSLDQRTRRSVQASVTGTTLLHRIARAVRGASLTATTALVWQLRRRLQASITSSAALTTRSVVRQLVSASSTLSTSLDQRTRRAVQASVTTTATLMRRARVARSASLTTITTLVRRIARALQASSTMSTLLTTRSVVRQTVIAAVTATTTLATTRRIVHAVSAAITGTTGLLRRVGAHLQASLTGSTQRTTRIRTARAATLTQTAQLLRRQGYRLTASTTLVAGVAARYRRLLGATVTLTRSLLTEWIEAATGWSGLLTARLEVQSRYEPALQVTTADTETTVQARYDADMAIEHTDIPLRLES